MSLWLMSFTKKKARPTDDFSLPLAIINRGLRILWFRKCRRSGRPFTDTLPSLAGHYIVYIVYICIYVYMYICIYVYMYMYIYVYILYVICIHNYGVEIIHLHSMTCPFTKKIAKHFSRQSPKFHRWHMGPPRGFSNGFSPVDIRRDPTVDIF